MQKGTIEITFQEWGEYMALKVVSITATNYLEKLAATNEDEASEAMYVATRFRIARGKEPCESCGSYPASPTGDWGLCESCQKVVNDGSLRSSAYNDMVSDAAEAVERFGDDALEEHARQNK